MTTTQPTDQDWQEYLTGLAMTEEQYGEYQAYAYEMDTCPVCDALGHGSRGCPLESPFDRNGGSYCQCGGRQALDGSGCLCGGS